MECNRKVCFKELVDKNPIMSSSCDGDCLISFDDRKNISISENRNNMAVFHVDGAMVQDKNTIKCDNLVLDTIGMKAIFVELKGTDLAHALQQINQTIDMMKEDIHNCNKYARIVTSNRTNVPNIRANPEYIKLYKKANVKVSANLIEEKISSL
jgi:activator of HSP90 ATPase